MVNSRYRPKDKDSSKDKKSKSVSKKIIYQDNPDVVRLSRAGCVDILTSPCSPSSPCILSPDIIHFDHKSDKADRVKGLRDKGDENDEHLIADDTAGMSVVDKLEHFKSKISSQKQPKHSRKSGITSVKK